MNDRRLYLHNIDRRTTVKDIEMIFSGCGDVGKVRVWNDRGIVDMLSVSGARRARIRLDGTVLWGRSLVVRTPEEESRTTIARIILWRFGQHKVQ